MARYRPYNLQQMKLLPISLEHQLQEGTFEYLVNYLVEKRIDMSRFDNWYKNDNTGRPAYSPKILLKVVLLGYSRGLLSSRKIEQACKENVVFMALTGGEAPDHSTIAKFISSMKKEILPIFIDVLMVCEEMDLLGGSYFALDGLRMSSNASKECSGTFKELKKKKEKLKKRLKEAIREHQKNDRDRDIPSNPNKNFTRKLRQKIEKIEKFLEEEEPKEGANGREIQSNTTDNESAKMVTSHGVIQGYNAQALVDDKHQIIVYGEVFGKSTDHSLLMPMLEGAKWVFQQLGLGEDYLKNKDLAADSNYFNIRNLEYCKDEEINAYIPDNFFRKRDHSFKTQKRHQENLSSRLSKESTYESRLEHRIFDKSDFIYNEERDEYICPTDHVLKLKSKEVNVNGNLYRMYRSREEDCSNCPVRKHCIIRKNGKTRYLLIPIGKRKPEADLLKNPLAVEMRKKIDSASGKEKYSKRLGVIEPVFGHIRFHKRMNYFTLRTKQKVNIKWLLFCIIHNMEKIVEFGKIPTLKMS